MKLKRKAPVLIAAASLVTGTAALATMTPAVASGAHPHARPVARYNTPKIVKLHSTDKKVVVSDDKFRPGVTQFNVTATSKAHATIAIVEADNLQRTFKLFNKAISGQPGGADAMKKVDRITTFYSGEQAGGKWQVKLSKGSYYAIDTNTNNLTTFTVKGDRRGAQMRDTASEIHTTKDNMFATNGTVHGKWVTFSNHSHEIHFFEADHVKNDTTKKDVQKSFDTGKDGGYGLKGGFFTEITSPGVSTVHKEDIKTGKYLLMCWMPSEEQDGVPHAMMGMWKLIQVQGS